MKTLLTMIVLFMSIPCIAQDYNIETDKYINSILDQKPNKALKFKRPLSIYYQLWYDEIKIEYHHAYSIPYERSESESFYVNKKNGDMIIIDGDHPLHKVKISTLQRIKTICSYIK